MLETIHHYKLQSHTGHTHIDLEKQDTQIDSGSLNEFCVK